MTPFDFFQGIRVALFTSAVFFGSYSVFTATDTTGVGTFSVQDCSGKASSFTAALSSGSGPVAARTMTLIGGTDKLQYNLYTSSTFTTIWGDTAGFMVSGTGATGPTSNTPVAIYDRIPAEQDVSAGTYTDSITLTISF